MNTTATKNAHKALRVLASKVSDETADWLTLYRSAELAVGAMDPNGERVLLTARLAVLRRRRVRALDKMCA